MSQWRAVQVVPSLEALADRSLRRLDVETFFPRRIIRRHRRGSPKVERAYFQGYLFANLEMVYPHVVLNARGVLALIGARPIPLHVMDELMARAEPSGVITEKLQLGSYYRLDRPGVLGHVLVKLDCIDEHNRARVLLRLLGLDRQVILPTSEIIGEAIQPS